jgi:capsular exopolysaccharide synthesis family protein
MEKIKQALERARSERASDKRVEDKNVLLPRECFSEGVQDIVYTQTKTVTVDKKELREKRVIVGDTNDTIADHYKVLRTQVIQRMKANQWNTLAITSPTEACGKTLTSINLSISLARAVNHSVLLVDMDLRRPSVHTYFHSDDQLGIRDYLVDGEELNKILFNPGLERLVVLPGNKSINNSSEMLSSPILVQLVNELKTRYPNRIVIFDMPPLLSCDDMLAFSPYIDAAMLVVEEGITLKEDLKRSYDLLEKTNVLGVVVNKSKVKSGVFSYY